MPFGFRVMVLVSMTDPEYFMNILMKMNLHENFHEISGL
jgi:hypothetical protein